MHRGLELRLKRGFGFAESPVIGALWMIADYACTPMQMTLAGCK